MEVEKFAECVFRPNLEPSVKENNKLLSNIPLYSVDRVDFATRQNLVKQFYNEKNVLL